MKPKLAITMGDPAGIGPEVVLKALQQVETYACADPIVFGDLNWMRRTAIRLKIKVEVVEVSAGAEPGVYAKPGLMLVRQSTSADLSKVALGELSADAGTAAAESVISAAKAAMAGEVDAVVTAPINKEAIALGGYPYSGHTELLAEITRSTSYGMLLLAGKLRVIHVSTHVPLAEAIRRVKAARILECIRLGNAACIQLGIAAPRVAVAGLNPHAGENGMFGEEEAAEIAPAVAEAQQAGIDATGPHAPDTVFAKAVAGLYDVVVAMYHDQGHIPVKLFGFDKGVNVTVGLPILRTSVDHGTAFDIAASGRARENSMLEAIRVAASIVPARESFPLPASEASGRERVG